MRPAGPFRRRHGRREQRVPSASASGWLGLQHWNNDALQSASPSSTWPAMSARQVLRVLLVGVGTSVVPLDTAVNIAFPEITGSFGLPIQAIQWVVICYVLTYSSLMLAFGRAGDVWSHGRVFRIGLLWSGMAYLLCASAPGYGWLLFSRFLQGIGAALIVSCA